MNVINHEECIRLSKELGIPLWEITEAFELTTETEGLEYAEVLNKLKTSVTQEKRWEIYDNTKLRKAKKPILQALLENAEKKEAWEIHYYACWDGFGEMILLMILDKFRTLEEIQKVHRKSSNTGEVRKAVVRALSLCCS